MTSIRKLKMIQGAGDPDDVLARRIDVVAAAEKWYDVQSLQDRKREDWVKIEDADDTLKQAVRRYRAAVKSRAKL